jgi:ribosome assembly protein YihI (activator of Der GTPase)
MNRPGAAEGKGITAKSATAALDRLKENKPLGAKQQEFVRYALDELESEGDNRWTS